MFREKIWVYMKVTHGGHNNGRVCTSRAEARALMKADTDLDKYCRTYVYQVNNRRYPITKFFRRVSRLFYQIKRAFKNF